MIDERTLEQARSADLIDFLGKRYGFTFAQSVDKYRCRQHPSLAVKHDRLSWFWHSKGKGGHGALDFLIHCECMPFREAVETVIGTTPTTAPMQSHFRTSPPPKMLILPEKRGIPLRLYEYLCNKRGIDGEIVSTLINRDKLYEDTRGNVVFVGYDEYLKPRFASLRGTHGDFRGDCAGSDKRYGFSISGFSERLYVFESPIDAMSHATLTKMGYGEMTAWEHDSRLSLSGTTDTAMAFFLNQHTAVKEIVFCLDKDHAGREASYALARKYADKGYSVMIDPPIKKDFNEELKVFRELISEAQRRSKSSHRDVDIYQ